MQTTTQRRDKGRQQYLEELVYNVRVQVGDHVHTPKTGSVDLFQYVSPNPQVKTNEPSNRTVSMTDMVHGYTCANNGNHFSTLFWDDVKFASILYKRLHRTSAYLRKPVEAFTEQ